MLDQATTPSEVGAAFPSPHRPNGEPLLALVVDDDPSINRLLQVRLKNRGFAIASAADGEQAIHQIQDLAPDLVMLDVSMPGTGGLEVLAWTREQALDVAIVMTTAFGSEQVAIDALRRGADDYLRKPFEPSEFRAVVQRTVDRLLLQRQNAELRRQLDEKRRQLEAELERASEIQAGLLPRTSPNLPGYDFAAACVPAREVGGNFFDWQHGDDGALRVALGDVMGKGMPAALLMATVRSALRATAPRLHPDETIRAIERALAPDLDRAGSFVTLVHARLDPDEGRLRLVDAGHGYSVIVAADGSAIDLGPRGVPLGLSELLGDSSGFQHREIRLRPGDALVLYSDGLVDARPDLSFDAHDIARYVTDHDSATSIVESLTRLALSNAPLPDDLTVVVLRRNHT